MADYKVPVITSALPPEDNTYIKFDSGTGNWVFQDIEWLESGTDIYHVGNVIIGSSTPESGITMGLTLDQGANDDIIFACKSSDVAHGMTGACNTDTYFFIEKIGGAGGGARLCGFTDASDPGIALWGFRQTATSTIGSTTEGCLELVGCEKSGVNAQAIGDADALISIVNYTTTCMVIGGDGSLWSPDTGGTAKWILGDNACGDITSGFCINQRGADDAIIALKSSDVSHGITGQIEYDTYGVLKKAVGDSGGVALTGFTEDEVAVQLSGIYTNADTGKDTSANAGCQVVIYQKDGTGIGDCDANANIFAVRARRGGATETILMIDEDGDIYYDGGVHNYDKYDDLAMIEDVQNAFSGQLKDFVKYNEEDLVSAGVLGAPVSKGGLVSHKGMTGLMLGAISQLSQKVLMLEKKLELLTA